MEQSKVTAMKVECNNVMVIVFIFNLISSLDTTRPFDWDEGDFLISLSLNLLRVNCNGFEYLIAQTNSS